MKNKIRICFIAPKVYPLFNNEVESVFGGAETQICLFSKKLAENEYHSVHVITADYGQRDKEIRDNVTIWKSFKFGGGVFVRIYRFLRAYENVSADVYLQRSLSPYSGIIALYSRIRGKKFIYMVAHDMETDGGHEMYRSFSGRILASFVFWFAHRIIVQNTYEKKYLEILHPEARVVLIKKIVESTLIKKHVVRVYDGIWVGRCDTWKNPEIFLNLAKANKNKKFAMVCPPATGKKLYFEKIKKQAKKLNNVSFHSLIPRREAMNLVKSSRVYCLTSRQEGDWPMVVLEAASAHTPVLSIFLNYDALIGEYNGGIYSHGDFVEFDKNFNLLLSDTMLWKEKSNGAQEYVKDTHNENAQAEKLLRTVEALVEGSLNDINEQKKLRICIISSIFHGFGKIGGFGTMTRGLAGELVSVGFDVVVIVPKRPGQKKITIIDGYTVLGIPWYSVINPFVYKSVDADLYHSQSPNLMSVAAIIGATKKKHVITCRDPRNFSDWIVEIKDATWKRKIKNILTMIFEEGPLISWAVRRADKSAYVANYLKSKIKNMYRLAEDPIFLPNIEYVPEEIPEKSKTPTVCWVGRLDGRKRPELFIELAGKFPEVEFIMVGTAEENERQKNLENEAKKYKNLEMLGYIDKFEDRDFYKTYDKSWIFVNTASREALPLTFIEAAGRGCAILSFVDPDGFASKFGFNAKNNNFEEGIRYLLEDNCWRSKGASAHQYVLQKFSAEKALNTHVTLYNKLLNKTSTTMNKKVVPIVILSWNKKEDTLACIASVYKLNFMRFEIIVFDNGSEDGSQKAIADSFPKVHLIENPVNDGVCVGRNNGWKYAEKHFDFDYILYLDNDTILDKNFLGNLHRELSEDKNAGIATGKAYGKYPTNVLMSCGMKVNLWTGVISNIGAGMKDNGQYNKKVYVDACAGFGYLVRKEVLDITGGLDLGMSPYGWDDVDFCMRALECGYKTLYAPGAVIYHSGTKQGRAPILAYEETKMRNFIYFIKRHANFLQTISVLIISPFRWLIITLGYVVKGHGNVMWAHMKGVMRKN